MMSFFLNRYFHEGKRGIFIYHHVNYKSIRFRPNGRVIQRKKTSIQQYNTKKILHEKLCSTTDKMMIRRCVVWFNHSKPLRKTETLDISGQTGVIPLTEIEDEFNIRKDGLFDNDNHNKATYKSIDEYLKHLLEQKGLDVNEFSFAIS